MATKLEKTLKREIEIDGKAYMVAISPERSPRRASAEGRS